MATSFNKRTQNQQQTSDSIAPPTYKNALSLDPDTRSGFDLIHRASSLLNKSELPNIVEDARVLEVLGDGQKVKYRVLTQTPEINAQEQKDGYMEDYLIKARSRNDIGTKTDPEQILINEYKETLSESEKQQVRKKYLYAVAEHDTLAPLYPSSFFSATPNVGDVIRIYYYNSLIDSGEEIKGFYEIVNQHSYFEKGEESFLDLLKNFRKKFSEIADSLKGIFELNRPDSSAPQVNNYNNTVQNNAGYDTLPGPNTATLTVEEVVKLAADADISQYISALPANSINREVVATAFAYPNGAGGEYKLEGNGILEDIYHNGTIFMKNTGFTYCSGATFTIAMRVINNRKLFANKEASEVRTFQQKWYGNPNVGDPERQQGPALESMGIGGNVRLEDALPGDFVQIQRANSGHSVIFLGWVEEGGERIGIKYRSSQGSGRGSGLGNNIEYFSDSPKKGGLIRNRLYFSRIKDFASSSSVDTQMTSIDPLEQLLLEEGLPPEDALPVEQ